MNDARSIRTVTAWLGFGVWQWLLDPQAEREADERVQTLRYGTARLLR